MTQTKIDYQPASNYLMPGSYVALLPNRALQLPILAAFAGARCESCEPGLRGLLRALGGAQSPAELLAVGPGNSSSPGHYYVSLELCFWQVEMAGARWMACAQGLNLSATERAEVVSALAGLFASSDAQLVVHPSGELSLLCAAETPVVQAAFPDEALGCELKSMLPTPSVWQRYLNEAQMVLASLPVNRARAARGEPVVNSVWFWGAEALAPDCAPLSVTYFGDDPILQALSVPSAANTVQICDYSALQGAELVKVIEQLPPTAKLWLNDGRVFQARPRANFLRRLLGAIKAKLQGGRP